MNNNTEYNFFYHIFAVKNKLKLFTSGLLIFVLKYYLWEFEDFWFGIIVILELVCILGIHVLINII